MESEIPPVIPIKLKVEINSREHFSVLGVHQNMDHSGQIISRREFELNLAAKREHPGFATDLADLLPVGTAYDFEASFGVVEQELIARL